MNRRLMGIAVRLASISSRALQRYPRFPEIFAPANGTSSLARQVRDGKRVTALLLGYSGVGDGRFLTDAIILASFDPASRSVILLSVPRDLWIQCPGITTPSSRWRKLNEAYARGLAATDRSNSWEGHRLAGQLACQAVTEVTGIPVHFWLSLNFAGFRGFINALGGVTIDVEKELDDYRYHPAHDESQVEAENIHIHFDAGPQRLDGDRAIMYVRTRYAVQDASDYGRSRRQVRLMSAVKDELLQPGSLLKIPKLLKALEGNLRTNLTFHDFRTLLAYVDKYVLTNPQIQLVSTGLSPANTLQSGRSPTGQWILMPRLGEGDYREIHEFVSKLFLTTGVQIERTSVLVQDASGRPALARKIVELLAESGIIVLPPVSTSIERQTTIHDYTGGRAGETLRAIQESLCAPVVPALPGSSLDADMIVVVIGEDFRPDDRVKPRRTSEPGSAPSQSEPVL